jgi:hypothetical protein
MINGAHCILFSSNSDADRDFLKNVLNLPSVDVGGGWLIFGLPPSEVAVHPADQGGTHELYLMCADIEVFVTEMDRRGIECTEVKDEGWGLLTQATLPSGARIGVYEPRHARPEAPSAKAPAPKPAKTTKSGAKAAAKKPAKAKAAAKKPVKAAAKKAAKAPGKARKAKRAKR